MDNNTRNQQRLAQYNAKRIQLFLALQRIAWILQAGSQTEYERRVNNTYRTTGFKQA